MSVVPIEDLAARVPAGTVIAGLDLGTKTIGIAVSDLGFRFATPRPVLRRTKFRQDAEALLAALDKERCGAIVIGLPLNMDGSEGPRAQSTRAFVRNLLPLTERPVVFWDERLSTVAAERAMIEADLSRRKRAEKIDSAAAAFILQGALDRLGHRRGP
ncbi:Holliday junction resolvase RuvX [Mangrovibrevibacter kandeliae]|uniref:Holliday junction resolvase RuvX n=1 Tax=Mangrovibrevibacter kandeliae TaxID=2968473 RepID=UPI002119331D|nr:Holliday junction resolvase RuvX [Aurantimonas sp. MSK8Z-1]MCQ8782515.1 Holliday junction resolvase RuvX [Aurantimonas sp. CSK15Z-1]MCW4114676.1 Holliday junction resolvase RuvX [Aurantimonas sp. MSK8Z-1]